MSFTLSAFSSEQNFHNPVLTKLKFNLDSRVHNILPRCSAFLPLLLFIINFLNVNICFCFFVLIFIFSYWCKEYNKNFLSLWPTHQLLLEARDKNGLLYALEWRCEICEFWFRGLSFSKRYSGSQNWSRKIKWLQLDRELDKL